MNQQSFGVPDSCWKSLEDAVYLVCDAAAPYLDLQHKTKSAPTLCQELDAALWDTVRRAFHRFASKQNRKTTASRLPDEILTAVFAHLPVLEIISASHVCRAWRVSALACPMLWSAIDAKALTAAALADLIRRSRPVPLQLDIQILSENSTDMALILVDNMHRIDEMRLSLSSLEPMPCTDDRCFCFQLGISDALASPAPVLRELSIRDGAYLLEDFTDELFGGQAPELRVLRFLGDLTRFPFEAATPAFEGITHLLYEPCGSGLTSDYALLYDLPCYFPLLQHLLLTIPKNAPGLVYYTPWIPDSVQHLELHVFQPDVHLEDFLDFVLLNLGRLPLLVVALHAVPCSTAHAQSFLVMDLNDSTDAVVDMYIAKAASGVVTLATADTAGRRRVFADFPDGCRPLAAHFASLTALSIGDTFWTIGVLPTMPVLAALEVHLSKTADRAGSVFILSVFTVRALSTHVLTCPSLRTLAIVADPRHDEADRRLSCYDVLMFVGLRLTFTAPRLDKLVLHHTMFTDYKPSAAALLSNIVSSVVSKYDDWSWTGQGSSSCMLPLVPGSCRATQSVFDAPWS